jgi:Tol biopolymer transport system component
MTALLGMVGIAAAAYFAYVARRAAPPAQSASPRTLSRVTFDDGLQTQPTWSPDGRFIAYSSDKSGNVDIWVQAVAGGRPVQVTNHPATDWQPSWSADGNTLAFRSERDGGGIYAVPALGGPEKRLAAFGFLPQWSPKKPELMFVVRPLLESASLVVPPMYLVGLDGAPPRRILADELRKFRSIEDIVWHPDGARISFSAGLTPTENGFFTLPLAGGAPMRSTMSADVQRTMKEASVGFGRYRWAPAGNALYFAGRTTGILNVWRIGVDPSTLAFVSGPDRLTTGTAHDVEIAPSPDGTKVAFVTKTEVLRLWSLPFDAASGRTKGPAEALTGSTLRASFDLSSDGRWLAFVVARPGKDALELWARDMDAGTTAMLAESRHYFTPRLSRDGSFVAYRTVLDTAPERRLAWMKRGVSGQTVLPVGANAWDWSADGTRILHGCPTPTKTPGFCLSPRDRATAADARFILSDPDYAIYQGRFSPDDRWVLFNAQSLRVVGTSVVGVVPANGGKWAALTDASLWADKPRLAPDGRTIYFMSNGNGAFLDVWGLRFDPSTGRAVGDPFRVTHTDSPGRTIDVSAGSELGVSATRLVLPMIEATGSIWVLDKVQR